MEYMGDEYFKTKSTVIKYERFLLKELGFCVHVKHPHKLVVTYLQMLDLQDQSSLVQRAWNNMNDSLRTNVFVRYTPEAIACACIFLAAKQFKISLPLRPPWWQVFGAKQKDLEAISLEILALYTRPKKLLDTLEKEVGILREKLAKKQVEIKEVNVKKITSSASPEISSPQPVEQTLRPEDKASSKSPLALSSLQAPKATSANPSPLTQSQSSKELPPIKNGLEKSPKERSRKRSRSPAVDNDHKLNSDHSQSRSPTSKLISSPLRLSSSESEQDQPGSASPPYNGIPERYRRDLEQERHQRKRHKHRSEKHHSKHSRSKYKSHDNERRREQQYYDRREEYGRSREVYDGSRNYRKRDKDYEREYYSSSKIRKTESVRYR